MKSRKIVEDSSDGSDIQSENSSQSHIEDHSEVKETEQPDSQSEDCHSESDGETQSKGETLKIRLSQSGAKPKSTAETKAPAGVKAKDRPKGKKGKSVVLRVSELDIAKFPFARLSLCYKNCFIEIVMYLLHVITFGLLFLADKWLDNQITNSLVYRDTDDFDTASYIKLDHIVVPLKRKTIAITPEVKTTAQTFKIGQTFFFWSEKDAAFVSLAAFRARFSLAELSRGKSRGLQENEVAALRDTFGPNKISRPDCVGIGQLISSPIGSFFVICVALCFVARMKLYGILLALVCLYQAGRILLEERRKSARIQSNAAIDEKVMVIRRTDDDLYKKIIINSDELVPGDLMEITNNLRVPADLLLTHGSCIVNEQAFDGDERTFTKQPSTDDSVVLADLPAVNTITAGSQVLFTLNTISEGCFGVVIATGWLTAKNQALIGKIQPPSFRFVSKTVSVLAFCMLTAAVVISLIDFALALMLPLSARHHGFINLLHTFVMTLCPVVPLAALAASHSAAVKLSASGVTAAGSESIEALGQATAVLIEAGALSTAEFSLAGFHFTKIAEDGAVEFEKPVHKQKKLLAFAEENNSARKLMESLGLCNVLTRAGDKLFGTKEEMEMLAQSPLELQNALKPNGVVERFFTATATTFSPKYSIHRLISFSPKTAGAKKENFAAVLAESEQKFTLFVRGGANELEKVCAKISLPTNFAQTVAKLSAKGQKVTAFAYKEIPPGQIDAAADEIIAELQFAGLFCANTAVDDKFASCVESIGGKSQVGLLSDASLFSALFVARQAQIVDEQTPILTATTEFVDGAETLRWTEMTKSRKNNDDGETFDGFRLNDIQSVNESFVGEYEGVFAVSAAALKLIVVSFSNESLAGFLPKCKVFAECADEDKAEVIAAVQSTGSVVFIHDGFASVAVQKAADVSFSLKRTRTAADADFVADATFDRAAEAVKLARAALDSQHKNVSLIVFFLVIRTVALFWLVYRRTLLAKYQLVFLDFAVLLGFAFVQARNTPHSPSENFRLSPVFSRKFFVGLAPQLILSLVFLLLAAVLISRTKFYDKPIKFFKDEDATPSADDYFLFDPFVLFITAAFLCLFAAFTLNSGNFLRRDANKKLAFFIYWFVLAVFLLLLLFRVTRLSFVFKLTRVFKAPMLFGFEKLLAILLALAAVGFFLLRKLSQRQSEVGKEIPPTTAELKLTDKLCGENAAEKNRKAAKKHKKAKKEKVVESFDEEKKTRKNKFCA